MVQIHVCRLPFAVNVSQSLSIVFIRNCLKLSWNSSFFREKEFRVTEEPLACNETDWLLGDEKRKQRIEKNRKKPSLLKVLAKMFSLNIFRAIIFKLFQDCLLFVQPQLLR